MALDTTTWYRVSRMGRHLTTVQVSKSTGKTVTLETPSLFGKGPVQRRVQKDSQYESFYPTFEEAKAELTKLLARHLSETLDELNELRAAIYQANNLTAEGVQQ